MRNALLSGMLFASILAAATVVYGGETNGETQYPMRGVLRAFDPKTGQATVAHEEVRGYMPPMTMSFDVTDPGEIKNLQPGDTFTCRLKIAGDHVSIAQVQKENVPPVSPFDALAPAVRSRELSVGDTLPDIDLVDQHGKAVRLHDFGGQPLAISFIYLSCPLPSYCPLLNHHFQTARDLLDRLGLQGKARFLSISMDPATDTPARLAQYAGVYAADGLGWTFATTREDGLRRLGDAVGLEYRRQGTMIDHNLRTVVVDGRGCLRRVFRGNTWTPQELAAELRAANDVKP